MRRFTLLLVILAFFINPSLSIASLVINELVPNPLAASDWVEIYNPTSSPIDLTNWSLFDNTSSIKSLSGSIAANGFLSFDVSNRLNNSADSIILKDSNGNSIDTYIYTQGPGIDKSFGRTSDGGTNWAILTNSSKGSTNNTSTPSSPTPIPTTPTPTPTPTPSSTFTLSNTPQKTTSTQNFNAGINLSLPSNPNTIFYLKGAFIKSGKTNYFGFTNISGVFVKNLESYSNQLKITTDSQGNWNGNLEVKPDASDSGFEGSGDYGFKVARYTSSGSGPTWSNEEKVFIENISPSISSSTPTPTFSSSPQIAPKASAKTTLKTVAPSTASPSSEVAGIQKTPEPTPEPPEIKIASKTSYNIFFIIAGISLILGSGIFLYLKKINL